ncbi:MAG: SpoIIE family protein phosphatase [Candidatus Wallbacteria bacterium]|nr:SpoIIE family protein phosphatase [Candidatus Wallbacteria bacterium]
MFKSKGLAFKLSFWILTGCLLLFFLLFWYNSRISEKLIIKYMRENASQLADAVSLKIESTLNPISRISENLAVYLEQSDHSREEISSFMHDLLVRNGDANGLCVMFEPGISTAAGSGFAPYFFRGDGAIEYVDISADYKTESLGEWYQIPRLLDKALWGEPYFDEDAHNQIICSYSTPFFRPVDGKKRFAGIVTVDVSLQWLESIVSKIQIFRSGYGMIVTRTGRIVTHPDKNLIMNESIFSLAEHLNEPELRALGKNMIAGQSGFARCFCGYLNAVSWFYHTPQSSTGWSLAIVIPEDELLADLRSLNKILILIALLGLITLLLMITSISRRITNPLCVLAQAAETIGQGNFNALLPVIKGHDEIAVCNESFKKMQVTLHEYIENLKKTTAAKEKIESDLRIAHEIQMGMVPKEFPPFPDKTEIDVFATIVPAKEVGGDLYDFFLIDDNTLCFAVGDVSGKGVPASLFMAVTISLLRAKAMPEMTASCIVAQVNRKLCEHNESLMFCTFFLGLLDLRTGKLQCCSAGHNPPYIKRADGSIEGLKFKPICALGISQDIVYEHHDLMLNPGDIITLYTDGVTEAENIDQHLYGEPRFEETLKMTCCNSAENTTRKILSTIKEFAGEAEQSDDITILTLFYTRNGE